MKPFKSSKLIAKTRSPKICTGCRKDIIIGSSCISLFEFLEVRYAIDYFHSTKCVKKAITAYFKNISYINEWLENEIQKSIKK